MVTEKDILTALRDGRISLPPLAVRLLRADPKLPAMKDTAYRPDALIEVSYKRRRWKFAAELKSVATPKVFADAVAAIGFISEKTRLLPMVVMPYLSPENLARLEEAGISGLDLCGNGVVSVPGELLVLRTGQPNGYPRSEPIRNVYRGSSSLVGRTLLFKPVFNAVGDIVTSIQQAGGSISIATVSKVLKTLEEDLVIDRTQGQIRLIQADKLLDALAENYRAPKIVERLVVKLATGERELPGVLAGGARRIGERLQITGASSASRYSVLAGEPVVAAYCMTKPIEILEATGLSYELTDRFANVELIRTADDWAYLESNIAGGVNYASPVQVYLELMTGDKRHRQTAEQVREGVLRRVQEYQEKP